MTVWQLILVEEQRQCEASGCQSLCTLMTTAMHAMFVCATVNADAAS